MGQAIKLATVQQRGQITIPIELRRKSGIDEGSIVAITETKNGILISPREVLAMDALDRIGEALKKRGVTLEELIESGREIRGEIYKEKFAPNDSDA